MNISTPRKSRILTIVSDLSSTSSGANTVARRLAEQQKQRLESLSAELEEPMSEEDKAKKQEEIDREAASLAEHEMFSSQMSLVTSQLASLAQLVEDLQDVQFTDAELVQFKEEFRKACEGMPISNLLRLYNYEYFKAQPRSIRAAQADVLVALFDSAPSKPEAPGFLRRLSLCNGALS